MGCSSEKILESVEKLRFRICRISENDLKPSFSCDAGTAMAGVLCPYPQAIFQHSLLMFRRASGGIQRQDCFARAQKTLSL